MNFEFQNVVMHILNFFSCIKNLQKLPSSFQLRCIQDWGTKKNDLYLKDYKGQLWIFKKFTLL
jgi:hypothetical protein